MAPILNMPQQLLELGRTLVSNHQFAEGLRILRRLLRLPELSPNIAAEANYLIAQVSLQRADYSEAKEALKEAIERDPKNARCHYLFARSHEYDYEDGCEQESLEHYATACALAPDDGRMASAFALKVTRVQDQERGLGLLTDCYRTHGDDPAVVEDFVNGLMDAGRFDQAELVVTQAVYRNDGDDRFRNIRRRFNNRLREEKLFGSYQSSDGDPQDILKFENFESAPANVSDRPPKPRGPKPPAKKKRADVQAPEQSEPNSPAKLPTYGPQMEISAVLKQSGTAFVAQLYEQLGLMGKTRADLRRKEIQTVLLQRSFLKSMIKRFSPPTRKLLRTIVQSGGYLPANVLFQNTGPDAPPPETSQPLLQCGLLYLGREQSRGRGAKPGMVAVVPVDLLERLAEVLGIDLNAD